MRFMIACLVGILMAGVAATAGAEGGAVPAGDIILTVGATGGAATEPARAFDLDTLRRLPLTRYETRTIWTEGRRVFEGVLLRDLLEAAGIAGRRVRAVALNDYAIDIPLDDPTTDRALVAYRLDGKPMTVRDKGPLWIVYPYDSDAAYRSETIYSRSIWQLAVLEIVE